MYFLFFFFNDTATTEIYTLSLHDALPISLIRTKPSGVDAGIEAEDEECFGAIVGQIRVHVTVDADEDGDHGKNSGNTDDHAEDSEKGAHLVLTKSTERHPSVLADVHAHRYMHGAHTSWRKASMGCRLAARRAGYTPKKTPTAAEIT